MNSEDGKYIVAVVPIDADDPAATMTMEALDGWYITVIQSRYRPIIGDPDDIADAIEEAQDAEENGELAEIIDFKPKGRPN